MLSMGISELESFRSDLNCDVVSEALSFPYLISFSADTGSKAQFSYVQYADPDPETSKVAFIAGTQVLRPRYGKYHARYYDYTESTNLIFVDPPRNGEEGCRRQSNRALDYMSAGANLETRHPGILLSNGI